MWALAAQAQVPTVAEVTPDRDSRIRYLEKRIEEGRGRRAVGVGLTIGGGVLLLGGGVFLGLMSGLTTQALQLPLDKPGTKGAYLSQATTMMGLGIGGLAAGVLTTVIGVFLWIQGNAFEAPYLKKLDDLQLGLSIDQTGTAVQVAWRW